MRIAWQSINLDLVDTVRFRGRPAGMLGSNRGQDEKWAAFAAHFALHVLLMSGLGLGGSLVSCPLLMQTSLTITVAGTASEYTSIDGRFIRRKNVTDIARGVIPYELKFPNMPIVTDVVQIFITVRIGSDGG